MGSANVDLVRSIYAGWERGDFFGSGEWVHRDIEFVVADGPAPGKWMGQAAMVGFWRDFLKTWEELRAVADDYRELDGERVLVLTRNTGRGKMSGLELGQVQGTSGANVFHVRSGRVTKLVAYFDRDRALADLGLSE